MKQHPEKFGIERVAEQQVYDQFIRKGKPGEGKHKMSQQQIETFKANFKKALGELNTKLGLNYDFDDSQQTQRVPLGEDSI